MEQHLADMQRAQKKKRAMADHRGMELQDLRLPQASQELPNEVSGTLAGTSVTGGAMGLERVVGAGGKMGKSCGAGKAGAGKAGAGQSGAGVVSDLRIPIISDIARLFGLGKGKRMMKKQGQKSREDERLAMKVKGLQDKMKGGSYVDPAFGVINQPAGSSEDLMQVANLGPMGSGYSGAGGAGAGMAKAQGEKMAMYLKELHGEGYAKEFAGGFWGILASLAAPLVGKILGQGKGKAKGKKKGGMMGTPELLAKEFARADAEVAAERAAAATAARASAPRQLPIVQMPMMPTAAQAAQRLGAPEPAAAGATAVAAAAMPERMYSGKKTGRPASADLVSESEGAKKKGKGKMKKPLKEGDRRKARAEVVKRVMAEMGLPLIEASKYVKEQGLF